MWYLAARRQGRDGESYVALSVIKLQHQIDVLQVKAMERGLVTVTAAALERGLSAEGKAVLDGILFDHDKAAIKPESKPALDVIAKFLKDHPDQGRTRTGGWRWSNDPNSSYRPWCLQSIPPAKAAFRNG